MSAPRLSIETKAAILRAYAAGESPTEISNRYGVDLSYPALLAKRRGVAVRPRNGWDYALTKDPDHD